jgi:hypothetical protein
MATGRVLDSDPDWIRFHIGNPDPRARKLRNFSGKMHFLVIFYKNFTTNKVKDSTNYFLKKILMNNTGIFDRFDSNFDFKKNLRKKLSSKVLF